MRQLIFIATNNIIAANSCKFASYFPNHTKVKYSFSDVCCYLLRFQSREISVENYLKKQVIQIANINEYKTSIIIKLYFKKTLLTYNKQFNPLFKFHKQSGTFLSVIISQKIEKIFEGTRIGFYQKYVHSISIFLFKFADMYCTIIHNKEMKKLK